MKQIPNYGDQRVLGKCIYCGSIPETREHVPPRVFLDQPYPPEIPVVEACEECNQSFSLDEEYVACLIDSVLTGTPEPNDAMRDKIRKIMTRKKTIVSRLMEAIIQDGDTTTFSIEESRVKRVIEKIARGHVLFEMNEEMEDATSVTHYPLPLLNDRDRAAFESTDTGSSTPYPEVGSRAMQRLFMEDDSCISGWVIVQPKRYRYTVLQLGGIAVRMVFSEYLAASVIWEH